MSGEQGVLLPGYTTAANKKFRAAVLRIISNLRNRMKKAGFDNAGYDRDALIAKFAAALGNPCTYCGEKIRVSNMSPDHTMPVSRGGGPWDIQVVCQRDNRRKGPLTDEEYRRVLAFYRTMSPEAQDYLFMSLSAGAAFPQMRRTLLMLKGGRDGRRTGNVSDARGSNLGSSDAHGASAASGDF